MKHHFATHPVRLSLGIVFAWAGIGKLWASSASSTETIYSTLAPKGSMTRSAVIAVEAILALWLLTGIRPGGAAILAMVVLSGFMGLVLLELLKPAPKPCGCLALVSHAGSAPRRHLTISLTGNVLMIAGCSHVFVRRGGRCPGAARTDRQVISRGASAAARH